MNNFEEEIFTYDKLFQILMESDAAFNECYLYFIDDVWNLMIHEEFCDAKARGVSEREVLARYMASWIPCEEHADKLYACIKEMTGG